MSTSVVCNTSLPPPSVSNDPPAGIGALVTNSTLAFVSVSEVSDSTVTVAFIADPVTLPSTNPNVTVGAWEADYAPSTFEVDEDNAFFNSFGLQELLPSLNNFMWTSSAENTDPNVTQPPYFPPNYNPGFGSGFCGWNSAQAVIVFANTVLYPIDGTGIRH